MTEQAIPAYWLMTDEELETAIGPDWSTLTHRELIEALAEAHQEQDGEEPAE